MQLQKKLTDKETITAWNFDCDEPAVRGISIGEYNREKKTTDAFLQVLIQKGHTEKAICLYPKDIKEQGYEIFFNDSDKDLPGIPFKAMQNLGGQLLDHCIALELENIRQKYDSWNEYLMDNFGCTEKQIIEWFNIKLQNLWDDNQE